LHMNGLTIQKPRIRRVEEVKAEASSVKTIFFEDKLASASTPGQFVMVWIPGVDEVPMSVSHRNPAGFTFKIVGEATSALSNLKKGDIIGVRGPLGRGFRLEGESILVVGGGIGVAPLRPLVEDAVGEGLMVHVVVGAKTGKELIFTNVFKRLADELTLVTEDGSVGEKGMAGDVAERIIRRGDYDQVYVCGPEGMMAKVFLVAEEVGVGVQASLERYVKCGFGICGSCSLGSYLVCKDGPVFDSKMLRQVLDEFGLFRRDSSGAKEKLAGVKDG